jgi:hypothetical protein
LEFSVSPVAGLARRVALVEQRRDLRLIEVAFDDLRLLRLGRLGRLHRLRRRLLLFLLDRLGDRIGLDRIRLLLGRGVLGSLWRVGLFLDRLRLFLRLLDQAFGGSGFFSTGFSSTFGCGGGAVSVTTGAFSVILPTASSSGLASATFLDQRLRVFLLAGLHAGHRLGELGRTKRPRPAPYSSC